MVYRFEIDGTITRKYRCFRTTGTLLKLRQIPPSEDEGDPVSYFLESVHDV